MSQIIVIRKWNIEDVIEELRFQNECAKRALEITGTVRDIYVKDGNDRGQKFWDVCVTI